MVPVKLESSSRWRNSRVFLYIPPNYLYYYLGILQLIVQRNNFAILSNTYNLLYVYYIHVYYTILISNE